jgi:hypothetical protein
MNISPGCIHPSERETANLRIDGSGLEKCILRATGGGKPIRLDCNAKFVTIVTARLTYDRAAAEIDFQEHDSSQRGGTNLSVGSKQSVND